MDYNQPEKLILKMGIHMDPRKAALALIEFQNDFTTLGGTLHEAVKPVLERAAYTGFNLQSRSTLSPPAQGSL